MTSIARFGRSMALLKGAGSGEEALSLLQRQSVDAVVLDVGMPGLSGIDVVTTLRSDPETSTRSC